MTNLSSQLTEPRGNRMVMAKFVPRMTGCGFAGSSPQCAAASPPSQEGSQPEVHVLTFQKWWNAVLNLRTIWHLLRNKAYSDFNLWILEILNKWLTWQLIVQLWFYSNFHPTTDGDSFVRPKKAQPSTHSTIPNQSKPNSLHPASAYVWITLKTQT